MLAKVRTPSGATCKGILPLEATFIDVKNMYLHRDYINYIYVHKPQKHY